MRRSGRMAAVCAVVALAGCSTGVKARLASPPGVATSLAVASSGQVPSRPLNATCPVMLGYPVDPEVFTVWNGRRIAFCDADARTKWEAAPALYAVNLPPLFGSSGDVLPPPARLGPAAPESLPATKALALRPPSATPARPVSSVAPAPARKPAVSPAPAVKAIASTAPAPKPVAKPAPAFSAKPKDVVPPVPPAAEPFRLDLGDGSHEGDDEECKDGSCRLPGR